MILLKKYYNSQVKREQKSLDIIINNPNHNIISISSSLRNINYTKFLYDFFERKGIERSKQDLYTYQKLFEFVNKLDENKNFYTQVNKFLFLLADSQELIDNFTAIDVETFESTKVRLNAGQTLGYTIQQILKDDTAKALEYLKIFEAKHKKYFLKEYDSKMLRAIIKGNQQEVEELLEFFLLPKIHNKQPDKGMTSHLLMSTEATVYAKLAWLKGIEVKVDHPLLPMELLPIRPNKEYIIEYDFLKPSYTPNVTPKQELPKPNAKYRKDKPKNKIGISKQLIEELLRKNWQATYTEKEIEDYVTIIYEAFINPQTADTKHYDFAKQGNFHIAYSEGNITYIESKPYSQMWTILENETDFFIDLLNSSFSIIGANLIDDAQYKELKLQLEHNATKKSGFFGKFFR